MTKTDKRRNFVSWGSLRNGDTILCPGDGIAETVTAVRPYNTHFKAWTSRRHNRFRPKSEPVGRV